MSETNIYDQFREYLQKLEKTGLNQNDGIEKHHIIPKHAGGKLGPIVYCSFTNHTLAHFYRFLVYKERGDLVAYKMRLNQKIYGKERCFLAVEKNKQLKILFWSSDWQKRQGKKGGLIGGSKKTLLQINARKRVGLKYGSKVGMRNQSTLLKKVLSKETTPGCIKTALFPFF